MPNRFIKESICFSESLARVSPEAERFWWRLVVQADDFGCYEARMNVLIGTCLNSMMHAVTEEQVDGWLKELSEGDDPMIELYSVNGKPYLHLINWEQHQQRRAKNPKYPLPPSLASTCKHMQAAETNGDGAQANVPYSNPDPGSDPNPKSLPLSPPTPSWTDGDFDALNLHLQGFFSDEHLQVVKEYWSLMREADPITWQVVRAETVAWAKKFTPEIIAEAMNRHIRRHADKPRHYTDGIMQSLSEEGWTNERLADGQPAGGHKGAHSASTRGGQESGHVDKYARFAVGGVANSGADAAGD